MLREIRPSRFHFDEHTARPDEIGEFGFLSGKTDAIFESATFWQCIRIVTERFEQMEQERLRFAFLVAFELRRKLGEFVEGAFL